MGLLDSMVNGVAIGEFEMIFYAAQTRETTSALVHVVSS